MIAMLLLAAAKVRMGADTWVQHQWH